MPESKSYLEPGEEIIGCIEDYGIVLLKPFLLLIAGWATFLTLVLIAYWLKEIVPNSQYAIFFVAFCILLLTHHFFFFFLIEYFVSTTIVTNKRIIEIKFFPFTEDDVSYIEINSIHEIEKVRHGLVKNFLNYGDIRINMSGRSAPIILQYIKYPSRIINLIEALKFKKKLEEIHLAHTNFSSTEKYRFLENH